MVVQLMPWDPPQEELENVAGKKDVRNNLFSLLPPQSDMFYTFVKHVKSLV